MPVTRDYQKYYGRIGDIMYAVDRADWDPNLEQTVLTRVGRFASLQMAQEVTDRYDRPAHPAAEWKIRRGSFEADEFEDDRYGTVLDVEWTYDDDYLLVGSVIADGSTVAWEEA